MKRDHLDARAAAEPGHREAAVPQWIDRLVELHVLADHGDTAAADAAASWMAEDGDARRVWEDVQQTCDQVRAAERGN
jgi:hypothetical protein